MIQRSSRRWFNNHDDILRMLTKYAEKLRLRVSVYSDRNMRSVAATRDMFHRALVIVAPHGAGESNMVFSQPGTVLMEGLCYFNGQLNLCYQVRHILVFLTLSQQQYLIPLRLFILHVMGGFRWVNMNPTCTITSVVILGRNIAWSITKLITLNIVW